MIKVLWGDDWDPLFEKDEQGVLAKRMGEVVDGQYQKYTVESAEYVRNHFFGADPALKAMADGLTDTEIKRMRRGGMIRLKYMRPTIVRWKPKIGLPSS